MAYNLQLMNQMWLHIEILRRGLVNNDPAFNRLGLLNWNVLKIWNFY
jgi:hypothetical protein